MQQYLYRLRMLGLKWVKKHKKLLTVLIIGILLITWIGIVPILIAVAVILLAAIVGAALLPELRDNILEYVDDYIKRKNEASLNTYLNKKCLRCGYMDTESWKKVLPWWYEIIPYETSFEEITDYFAACIEKQYIENDKSLAWLDPIVLYLTKRVMADVMELEKVPSPNLEYTHSTPNAKLIYDAMNYLCITKKSEGRYIIQKIQLEEAGIREYLNIDINEYIPEYYKMAYRINDYFVKKRKNNAESNIVSEEISFEDL